MTAEVFDRFAKIMCDKGWQNVGSFIRLGIGKGSILEIGMELGYVGLEVLMTSPDAVLTGCEISREMI